jgi:energy-coupling factor transporter ATP-binding protein EcfA2
LELRQKLEGLALALGDVSHQELLATTATDSKSKPAAAAAAARARREEPPDPEPLLRWAESPPQLSERRAVKWLAWAIPPVTVGTILLAILGPGVPSAVWMLPLALGILVNYSSREQTARVFGAVSSTEGAFLRYGAMLEVLEQIDLPAQFLSELRQRVLSAEARPSAAMKRFRDLVGWFDLKHNGLIHPFVNALLLWDIHCVLRLEAWQRQVGRRARQWFDALGEFEALSSLAALAHDEPDFAFPEIVEDHAVFDATELGHPLLDAASRVPNDVTLEGPGAILLVTGSNMSGKSTLLRAMGLACVLALAGAPVCARRMRIARCTLRTSIRVSDSLESGISHFYAELRKLKAVLEAAADDAPVLFLLDEILHGTNSRERQIGAKWLLSELLRMGAIGAASTHDMGLTRLPEKLADQVQLVHFRESIDAGEMTFDYRLRPGPVTAGNALRLMRIVGLDVPVE